MVPNANVNAYGNYIHDLSYFYPDPNHPGGTDPINNATHNDGMQIQGGANILIQGNYINAVDSTTVGTQPLPRPQSGQILQIQMNVNQVSNIVVENNWFGGGQNGVHISSVNSLGLTGMTITVQDNLFDHNQWDWGGSLHYYLIRPDTGITLNGTQYPSGPTTDTNGNDYYDTGASVIIRCDQV